VKPNSIRGRKAIPHIQGRPTFDPAGYPTPLHRDKESTLAKIHAGIDVAKDTFVAVVVDADGNIIAQPRTFNNKLSGFKRFTTWITSLGAEKTHVCIEATGVYSQKLAHHLHRGGRVIVHMANPRQTKAYATAALKRSKTDTVDAITIALFSSTQKLPVWKPHPPEVTRLRSLTRRRDDLVKMRTAESNRLHSLDNSEEQDEEVKESILLSIEHIERQIKHIEKRIIRHVDKHPDLADLNSRLKGIPGVGDVTSRMIMSYILPIANERTTKQTVAYIGLDPACRVSGTSIRGRTVISKTGHADLRTTLYQAAQVAARYNPLIKQFFERLRSKGKCYKVAIVACARKLLTIIHAMIRNKTNFNTQTT
jgi:transposase